VYFHVSGKRVSVSLFVSLTCPLSSLLSLTSFEHSDAPPRRLSALGPLSSMVKAVPAFLLDRFFVVTSTETI